MENLQTIINKRAEDKLNEDIQKLSRPLWTGDLSNLCNGLKVNVGTADAPKVIDLRYILSESGFKNKIIENHLPAYQERETKLFLKEIEQLKERVSELDTEMGNVLNSVQY